MINSWDWTARDNEFEYIMDVHGIPTNVTAPFYPNDIVVDTSHPSGYSGSSTPMGNNLGFINSFLDSEDFEHIDYYPSDGWELLHKDFKGTDNHNFFALYNRYAGVIRVFYYLNDDQIPADEVILELNFTELSNRTGLLATGNLWKYDLNRGIQKLSRYLCRGSSLSRLAG